MLDDMNNHWHSHSHWKLHPPLTGKVDNQNSSASLQRITISIRNKSRYLQGWQCMKFPPVCRACLRMKIGRQKKSEKDEERGTGQAGERRSGWSNTRNDYYDGDNDVDQDPTSGRGTHRTRGSRARGRGRGGAAATTQIVAGEDGESELPNAAVAPAKEGRGRN